MPESAPPQEPIVVRMPIVRLVSDGVRVVLQVVGSTTTPPGTYNNRYIGANGYVENAADAVNIRGPEGPSENNTTIIEGSPGTPGKSAYTIWLEAGNSGSIATFLASLKGAPGDPPTTQQLADTVAAYLLAHPTQDGKDATDAQVATQLGVYFAAHPVADGKSVELQATATYIQWRQVGGTWANLIALSALKGADGKQVELQKTATAIQWRLTGGTWADLVLLADLKGDTGSAGQTLLRQINITETATLAITIGTFEKQYACAGAIVGERYMAFIRSYKLNGAVNATAGRPDGYWIVAIDCRASDTVNVVYQRPAIALAVPANKYELFTDIVKVNAS